MKILIMNRKYGDVFGGVEIMSTSLANEMVKRGHEVHLLSLDFDDAQMYFDIDSSIKWHKIAGEDTAKPASWGERFARFGRIRRILQDNAIDLAIGFQDGAYLSLVTAALGTGVKVIGAERNAPTRFDYTSEGKFRALRYQLFRLASAVTIQCESFRAYYPAYLHRKMYTIPNPVFPVMGRADPTGGEERNKLLFVGRFSYQKNLQVLVKAFAKIASDHPDWDLHLVGDGEDRAELEELAEMFGLTYRVIMAGATKDAHKDYESAQLFVLPSRWEGFPNALAEAMAHGLPAVGFADCAGVRDLIVGNGVLAAGMADADSLAGVLSALMVDADRRDDMGARSVELVKQYEPEKIYDQWEDLFQKLVYKQI